MEYRGALRLGVFDPPLTGNPAILKNGLNVYIEFLPPYWIIQRRRVLSVADAVNLPNRYVAGCTCSYEFSDARYLGTSLSVWRAPLVQ